MPPSESYPVFGEITSVAKGKLRIIDDGVPDDLCPCPVPGCYGRLEWKDFTATCYSCGSEFGLLWKKPPDRVKGVVVNDER